MPPLSPDSIPILEGNIILKKRNGSSKWQAIYKIGSRWIYATTKPKDLEEAKELAVELYMDAKYRLKHNIPVTPSDLKCRQTCH